MPSKRAAEVKRRLQAGEVVLSAWLTFDSPAVAEVIAGTGFDILLIDFEHTSLSLETLERALASVARWDPVTIVRVPGHDAALIKRVLDIGADGIIAPMVMDADQARGIVAAVKYPPFGRRGYGPRRASDYFRNRSYFSEANDRTFVIVQIEHPDAALRAAEIAAVAGIDVICQGPADMAVNLGHFGEPDHPMVEAAIEAVFAAARHAGLPVCMGRYEPAADQLGLVARGARFVIASDDLVVLRNGLTMHLDAARQALATLPGART